MRPPHASHETLPLVVLSHLRWSWVWQRPQHLVSRLARHRAVYFVEEPLAIAGLTAPRIADEAAGPVHRVWLEVPGTGEASDTVRYGDERAADYGDLLSHWLAARIEGCDVWLYTPMALDLAEALGPRGLIYDVMDDLGSFADAPTGIQLMQRRALDQADVVFTGGRSLHRGVITHRPKRTYLFPSGVETAHYATSRELRQDPHEPLVAGYVGVIDERMDLALLDKLAIGLPDWEIQLAGPVTKIDPATLPRRGNIRSLGMQAYDDLPAVMAGFDVALMPFAINDATRSISPTKTLEYLAAGLPVVSTRVPDVVADFGAVVHLADTGTEFADACREVVTHCQDARDRKLAPIQERHEWDTIAAEMTELMQRWIEPAVEVRERPEETA